MSGPEVKAPAAAPSAPAKKEILRVVGVERGEEYVVHFTDGTNTRMSRKAYNKLVRPRVLDEE